MTRPLALLAALLVALALFLACPAATDTAYHLMLVNDDGVEAPGLAALAGVLADDPAYRLSIVAPLVQQSGSGQSMAIREEIAVRPHPPIAGAPTWSVESTPATTAKVGLTGLLADDPPDLVVSGINRGENSGRIAWYSGTVAAAREAALSGVPAVAFSLQLDWSDPRPDYAGAAAWAKPVIDAIRRGGLPAATYLNVNIPRDVSAIKGYRVARMGLAADRISRYEEVRSEGEVRFFKSVWAPPVDDRRGGDNLAVREGWVAVVPLGIDQTDYRALAALQDLELASCRGPAAALGRAP